LRGVLFELEGAGKAVQAVMAQNGESAHESIPMWVRLRVLFFLFKGDCIFTQRGLGVVPQAHIKRET